MNIDLSTLPRKKGGFNKIDWFKCKKCKVNFIHNDIKGIIEIVDVKRQDNRTILYIKYNNKIEKIKTDNFQKCKLQKILGERISGFKVEIDTKFKDNKRDITITDREYRQRVDNKGNNKWYKYTCNVCGWTEGWVVENALISQNVGCSCCKGFTVGKGINDIPTVANWMIPYFQDGYNEAKLYTCRSMQKIQPICPDCGRVKSTKLAIDTIYKNHSIGCSCSDRISYPEKIMHSVLEQLELEFQTQLTKSTFKWIEDYRYDFYFELNNEQYIIETNGNQHYQDAWDKLEKTQENDRLKKQLALKNGINLENYIIIDCRESTLEWIKQNIFKSNLARIFDLNQISWLKAEEFALTNLAKIACEYKRDNVDFMTTDIAKIMNLSSSTIRNYLKRGSKIWDWINYDGNYEKKQAQIKATKIRKANNNY